MEGARTALLARLFDAFDEGDIETLVEHYHPDAELWLTELYTPPGTAFHGREGLRTLLEQALPQAGVVRLEPEGLHEYEDSVLVDLVVRLDVGERRAAVLYTFDGDLIKRVAEFGSREDAIAAATKRGVLTPREREVFQLLARGRTGPEIADELVLSIDTVRTHVRNAVARMGAQTRVQAIAMALELEEISL
jgi:DNA-binding CsgD family transcriptional regulator/ketosteroid isomerase-like protein